MRALGLLFGATSPAAAVTLAAFFLGLAAGGLGWGKAAARSTRPLRLYGGLELAAAVFACLYFFLPDAYRLIYPWLFERLQADYAWLLAVKFGLALAALLPSAFFMGGSLPALSRLTISHGLSGWYAANVLGAALGALAAGFVLPGWLGYGGTYTVAIALSAGAGLLACVLPMPPQPRAAMPTSPQRLAWPVRALALWSGLAILALQVLWTRMFAQVLQNSVYTFAAVLTVFLLCLAGGALLAHGLTRRRRALPEDAFLLLTAAGLAVAATPTLFLEATDGLQYIGAGQDWPTYVAAVLWLVLKVIGLPLLCLGALLPRLLDDLRQGGALPQAVGQLLAVNTAGSIAGALLAGFVLLPWLGLWESIRCLALVYLLAAFGLAWSCAWRERLWQPVAVGLTAFTLLDVSSVLPLRLETDEKLLWLQEDSAATVAVVQKDDGQRRIKVNNHYTLGGSASRRQEALLGYLPVRLHPQPQQVFFLGLGTGISAGGALPAGAGRITVAELLPGAVTAAREYFGAHQHGLLQSPKARVVPDDGRNQLTAAGQRYDVIVADLFVPWEAGAGNLYTLEHFQTVRRRLHDGGWFMQWLPAYQLSPDAFAGIVHTLQLAFPDVSLWRGDFSVERPVLGLLARARAGPFAAALPLQDQPALFGERDIVPLAARLVAGDAALRRLYQNAPGNRDDRPVIEWQAPIAQRRQKTGLVSWLTGNELLSLLDRLHSDGKAMDDGMPVELRHWPEAGYHLHRAQLLQADGYLSAAEAELAGFRALSGAVAD